MAGDISYRERIRIKSAVLRATEQDSREIFALRDRIRELEERLKDARKSRDKWKSLAYRCGGLYRKKREAVS